MDDKIIMIPAVELYPHPDNPRRELGDLTELSDSIRERGVLQNLTVTPREAAAIPFSEGTEGARPLSMQGLNTCPAW